MSFWPAMSFLSFAWFCLCVLCAGFFWHAGAWLFGRLVTPRAAAPPS